MAVRSYVVVGDHSDPDSFHDYLYTQLQQRENLHLEALEELNELATRKGAEPQRFTFVVREIHREQGYLNVATVDDGDWIQLRVDTDGKLRFNITD